MTQQPINIDELLAQQWHRQTAWLIIFSTQCVSKNRSQDPRLLWHDFIIHNIY